MRLKCITQVVSVTASTDATSRQPAGGPEGPVFDATFHFQVASRSAQVIGWPSDQRMPGFSSHVTSIASPRTTTPPLLSRGTPVTRSGR